MLYQRLIDASVNALHTQFFKKKIDNLGRTILFGGSFDTTVFGDNFKDYDEYVSLSSIRCINAIKQFEPWIFYKKKVLSFLNKVFGDNVQEVFIKEKILH